MALDANGKLWFVGRIPTKEAPGMEVIDTFVQTPFEIDMSDDVGIAPGHAFRCMRGGWENTEFVTNDGRLFTWAWNREVGRTGRFCPFCSVCVCVCA